METVTTYQTKKAKPPKSNPQALARPTPQPDPRFAPRPDYLDTDPVYAEIDRMNGVIKQDDFEDVDITLKLVTAYHRLMRFLFQVIAYNRTIKQKWDMLSNPRWRKRVLYDLGGEWALRRWEARKARSEDPPAERSSSGHRPQSHAASARCASQDRASSGPKTDRDGLFCLAPIRREREAVISPNLNLNLGLGLAGSDYQDPSHKPIPLTPDELRGRRIEPVCTHDTGLETVTTRLSTAMSRLPRQAEPRPLQMIEQVFAEPLNQYYENPV